jgi:hypothetical protein
MPWFQSIPENLIEGSLVETEQYPLALPALLCDLRPRFLPKGRVGRGYRAVARNGRVLLASDLVLDDLSGRLARVRVQTWHKAILRGDRPAPYGLLLCVREGPVAKGTEVYRAWLEPATTAGKVIGVPLRIEVGGGMALVFTGCSCSVELGPTSNLSLSS